MLPAVLTRGRREAGVEVALGAKGRLIVSGRAAVPRPTARTEQKRDGASLAQAHDAVALLDSLARECVSECVCE